MYVHMSHIHTHVTTSILLVSYGSLSAQVSATLCLECNDDFSKLDVSLLLKLSKDTSSEEHLGVAHTVRGWIQVQSFQLNNKRNGLQTDAYLYTAQIHMHVHVQLP